MADLPPLLARALDDAADTLEPTRLRATVEELMGGYRSQRLDRLPRLDTPERTLAYALYRMPATFAAVHRVLAEVAGRVSPPPSSFVDVAGGTGAGAWAIRGVFGDTGGIVVIDRSVHALDLGRALMHDGAGVEWRHGAAIDVPGADLALASYLLGELDEAEQSEVLEAMAAAAPTVVVVEPGTTAGYRRILAARERLVAAGMRLAAPCPQDGPCPLTGDDWCHFASRFTRPPMLRWLKRAEHGYEDEKYSYVAATRLAATPAPGRILRHPRKRQKGVVRLETCTPAASAESLTIPKRHPTYRAARSVRWGGPWPPEAL